MILRRTLSSCVVVALSFGLGDMAYSQASSSAQPVPASVGATNASEAGMAQETSSASLTEEYARIAALAAHPDGAKVNAMHVPVFRAADGRPIELSSAGGAFAGPGGALRAGHTGAGASAGPSGARQASSLPTKSDTCSTPGDACSTNWSGLEDWTQSPAQTFTGLSADWTVSTVQATSDNPEDTSTWIGIDGDSTFDDTTNPSLIQIGTDSPSDGQTADDIYYEAWYELLPGYEIPLFLVSPGDQMQAVITETAPDVWSMGIEDVTAGIAWSYAGISYDSPGFTAEFIQEATTLCPTPESCAISSIQNFGTISFSDMAYVNSGTVQSQKNYMVDDDNNLLDDPVVSGNSMTVTYGPPSASSPVTASLPDGFSAMAVDTTNGDVFVSSSSSNTVTEVNPSDGDILGQATVDGASGIAVAGGLVYVAATTGSSPGIYVINPASPGTASELGSGLSDIATGGGGPISLVYENGDLWTTTSTSELAEVSLTGDATTTTTSVEGAGLVADPADNLLFSYNPGDSPTLFNGIDVASTPTVTVPSTGVDGDTMANVRDAAVSPNGGTLVPAAGSPYDFVELSASNLSTTGVVYPANTFPTAVAMTSASSGMFAGGIGNGQSAAVAIYGLDAPSTALFDYQFGASTQEVDPGGLQFSPDGTELYVVTEGNGGAETFDVVPIQLGAPTAGEGSIRGFVTGGSVAQSGVCVYAIALDGSTAEYSAVTGAFGDYDFSDVVGGVGEYRILADPTCGDTLESSSYAIQFYGGSDYSSGSSLTVGVGETVTGKDISLAVGSTISGQVTDGSGGVDGACVDAYSTSGYYVNEAKSNGGGNYTIYNLPVDDYKLVFNPSCAGTTDALQFYNDEATFPDADAIDVTSANTTVSAKNANLSAQATISGTVTEAGTGTPPDYAGVCVIAYATDDPGASMSLAVTDEEGTYEIDNLPAGSYNVAFDPTCQGAYLSDYQVQSETDVIDPDGGVSDVDATLSVAQAGPSIVTSSLGTWAQGSAQYLVLRAAGGVSGWDWTISGLPEGLDYSPGGVIFGTPDQAGMFPVQLVAIDGSNPSAQSEVANLDLQVSGGGSTSSTTTTTTSGGGAPPGGGGAPPASPTTTATTTPSTSTTTGVTTTTAPTTTTTLPPLPFGSVTATIGATGTVFSNTSGGASATVKVPAGALPAGTKISISPIINAGALTSELPPGQAYVVAFSVSWLTPEGTSPAAGAPITMTIVDPAIKAGDTIYLLTPSGLRAVGVATVNGRVTITFTTDPEFVVAAVPRITGVGSAASLKGAVIGVNLSCGPAIKCSGTSTLTAASHKGGATVTLAQGRFTVAAGKTKAVPFTETAAGKAFLKDHKDIAGQLTLTLMGGKKSTHQVRVP